MAPPRKRSLLDELMDDDDSDVPELSPAPEVRMSGGTSKLAPSEVGDLGNVSGKIPKLPADATAAPKPTLLDALLSGPDDDDETARARSAAQPGDILEAPTLDLKNRPVVHNPDGSLSTVNSVGLNIGGKEYLLPQVSADGRMLDDKGAMEEFKRTGKHMGVYSGVEASNRAGEREHLNQMANPPRPTANTMPDGSPWRGANIAPSLEGIEPVAPADDVPGWRAALRSMGDAFWPPEERAAAQQRQRADLTDASRHFADMATPTGMAAKGASYLASPLLSVAGGSSVLGNVTASATKAGLDEYAEDTSHDPVNAGYAAAGGVALAGLPGLIGQGAKNVAKTLGKGADWARTKSWGLGDKAIEEIERRKMAGGPTADALSNFVKRGEELIPPNRLAPRSPASWRDAAKPVAQNINQGIEDDIARATAAGAQLPSDPRGQISSNLFQQGDNAYTSGIGDGTAMASALDNEARAVRRGPQFNTPQDVRKQKIAFDKATYEGAPGTPESYAGQASEAAGHEVRGMLDDYVGQGGPELSESFRGLNDDYAITAMIRDAAADRARKQQATGGWVPRAAGAVVGGTAGAFLGGPTGAILGAGAGYSMPANTYAADLGANVARGLGGGASAVGSGLNWASSQAPIFASAAASYAGSMPPGGPHDATATGDGWLGQTAPETQGAIDALSRAGGQGTSQPQAPYLPPPPANVITGSSWVSQGSPDTQRIAQGLSAPIGGPAVAGQRTQPSRSPTNQSDGYAQQRAGENSRGFMIGQNLEKLSEEKPDLLAPYASYFQDADTPEEEEAVAERLARQNIGNFKRDIWPILNGSGR